MHGRRASAVLACVAALVACTHAGRATRDVSLRAELTQYRRDQPLRQVQVELANTGTAPVRVEALRLDAPGFAAQPPAPKDSVLTPGRRVDLPVPHGDVHCDVATPAGSTDGVAVATVRVGDGDVREVGVPLSADGAVLALVRRRECARQALEAAVRLDFARSGRRRSSTARRCSGRRWSSSAAQGASASSCTTPAAPSCSPSPPGRAHGRRR